MRPSAKGRKGRRWLDRPAPRAKKQAAQSFRVPASLEPRKARLSNGPGLQRLHRPGFLFRAPPRRCAAAHPELGASSGGHKKGPFKAAGPLIEPLRACTSRGGPHSFSWASRTRWTATSGRDLLATFANKGPATRRALVGGPFGTTKSYTVGRNLASRHDPCSTPARSQRRRPARRPTSEKKGHLETFTIMGEGRAAPNWETRHDLHDRAAT